MLRTHRIERPRLQEVFAHAGMRNFPVLTNLVVDVCLLCERLARARVRESWVNVSEYAQQTLMTISLPNPRPFLQVLPYGFVVAPRRILYGLGSGEEQVSTSCI